MKLEQSLDIIYDFYWSYYFDNCITCMNEVIICDQDKHFCDLCKIRLKLSDNEIRLEIEDILYIYDCYREIDTVKLHYIISRTESMYTEKINKKCIMPKQTKIINLVASPCAGKSTLACELFVYMKKLHIDVEYITEFAKDLVWKKEMEQLNNQYYVCEKQYAILKSVYGQVDYIICDSPLFMGLFYNYYNQDNVSDTLKTAQVVLDRMEEFDNNIYIFIKRNKQLPYMQAGRVHSEDQSSDIEDKLLHLLKCCDIDYTPTVTGNSVENLIDSILFS